MQSIFLNCSKDSPLIDLLSATCLLCTLLSVSFSQNQVPQACLPALKIYHLPLYLNWHYRSILIANIVSNTYKSLNLIITKHAQEGLHLAPLLWSPLLYACSSLCLNIKVNLTEPRSTISSECWLNALQKNVNKDIYLTP